MQVLQRSLSPSEGLPGENQLSEKPQPLSPHSSNNPVDFGLSTQRQPHDLGGYGGRRTLNTQYEPYKLKTATATP